MTPRIRRSQLPPRVYALCLVAAALGGLPQAQAQSPIYRSVGADGRVSFSDRPAPGARVASPGEAGPTAPARPSALPYALQQVVQRYPVTLYTGPSCGACTEGRQLLQQRGIPFAEKTISTAEDLEAFQIILPERTLPLLSLGEQKVKGFVAIEWQQYLDAAGYPGASALPATYRAPPPSPLSPIQARPPAASTTPAEGASSLRAPAASALPSGSNPAGIRF